MVIWIIGKSGSGKSYIAKQLYDYLKIKNKRKVIWIDGDKFRKKNSKDLGYSLKDRKINSKRIQVYCKKFDNKDYIVICSILSIFTNHQKRNRKIFKNYLQIFIKADIATLKKRNNKGIYNKKKFVVGKDILFPKPYKSDLIIKNKFDNNFKKSLKKILKILNEKL